MGVYILQYLVVPFSGNIFWFYVSRTRIIAYFIRFYASACFPAARYYKCAPNVTVKLS